MDKYKIGTDASMATHVNTICERAYVLVNKETRELGSTELGNAVIQGIRSIDPDLASPKLRSDIEK